MRTDAPIISCFHLAINGGGTSDSPQPILNDVTFEVPGGSWNEVIGPPGSGKSHLFGILSLRMPAHSGKLVVGGRNFDRLSKRGVADLRRIVTSASQQPLLLEDRTMLENLVLPFVVRRSESGAVEKCVELLAEVGLEDRRDVRVSACSHEERLLLVVLRAVATSPKLILVDGVLEGLSEPASRHAMRLLQQQHLAGATVVVFGREESSNSRRGNLFRIDEGRLEAVDYERHERVPETGLVA